MPFQLNCHSSKSFQTELIESRSSRNEPFNLWFFDNFKLVFLTVIVFRNFWKKCFYFIFDAHWFWSTCKSKSSCRNKAWREMMCRWPIENKRHTQLLILLLFSLLFSLSLSLFLSNSLSLSLKLSLSLSQNLSENISLSLSNSHSFLKMIYLHKATSKTEFNQLQNKTNKTKESLSFTIFLRLLDQFIHWFSWLILLFLTTSTDFINHFGFWDFSIRVVFSI